MNKSKLILNQIRIFIKDNFLLLWPISLILFESKDNQDEIRKE